MSLDSRYSTMKVDGLALGQKIHTKIEGSTLLTEEYTEIDRILFADACANINRFEPVGAEIECEGAVRFNIAYVDTDEEMGRAEVVCRFVQRIPNAGDGRGAIEIATDTYDIICKLEGGRQIDVQCAVELQAKAHQTEETRYTEDIAGGAQVLKTEQKCMVMSARVNGTGSMREEVELNSRVPVAERVIANDPSVVIKEVQCTDGTVFVAGDVVVYTILYTKDEYEPCVQTVNVFPFSQPLKADDAAADMFGIASGEVRECYVKLQENAMGEKRILQYELELSLCAEAYSEQNCHAVADAYSTEMRLECVREEKRCISNIEQSTCTSVVRAELTLPEGKSEMAKVCAVSAKPIVVETESFDGQTRVAGILEINAVYISADDGKINAFSSEEPFEVISGDGLDNSEVEANVCVESIAFTMQSSTEMEAKLTLKNIITSKQMSTCSIVTSVEEGESYTDEAPAIRICVIRDGERLWDVGKRMRIALSDLRACNADLPDDPPADSRVMVYSHLAK